MLSVLKTRGRWRWPLVLALVFILLAAAAPLQLRPTSVPPAWWQRGWPRTRVDSGGVARAKVLSQLAVLLMPETPVWELFRSFPSAKGGGENSLEPDLVAYGVLKDPNAALFVEYDGGLGHAKREDQTSKQMKNKALLAFGPPGSCVLRISHTHSGPLKDHILQIRACPWHSRNSSSLDATLRDMLTQALRGLEEVLSPQVAKRLGRHAKRRSMKLSGKAEKFLQRAIALTDGNTTEEISQYLEHQGFSPKDIKLIEKRASLTGKSIEREVQPVMQWLLDIGLSKAQIVKATVKRPGLLDYSVEDKMNPTLQWLLNMGLTKAQVGKVIAHVPQILSLSIDQNLVPRVQWLFNMGLSNAQVAKAVARHPQILSCRSEQNLKPKTQWLLNFGLSQDQVVKVIVICPQILSCNIEQNLKPTVQWLLAIGLSKEQVVKAIATLPQILGLSIEQNLKPKYALLAAAMEASDVEDMISRFPQIFSYSYQRLSSRLRVLLERNETHKLAKAMSYTEDGFKQRFDQEPD